MKQAQAINESSARRDAAMSAQRETHPAVIVHLGAGACSELANYLALQPERIILVEANPDEARRLGRRVASIPEVELIPVAIAATSGQAKLKIFNLTAFSSLRTPTVLRRLFPGLRLQGETEVEAITPVELIERLKIDPNAGNWLVIDVPGEEATTIDALRKAGLLGMFERIVLQCGRSALYEGAGEADALTALLQEEGYDISSSEQIPDPDFLRWILQRNPLRIENAELHSQVKALNQKLQEQTSRATAGEQKLEQLSRQRDEIAGELAEFKARLEQADKSQAEQTNLAAERQGQIEQLKKAHYELARLTSEHYVRIKQLESNLADIESRERLLMEEMARAEGQIDVIKDVLQERAGETMPLSIKHLPLSHSIETLSDTLKQQNNKLNAQIKQQAKELTCVRDYLSKTVKTEITNASKQLEAFFSIQSYFESDQVMGGFHGWSISPDLALYLIQQLEARTYDLVIEFGSGTSTQLIGKTLARITQRQPARPKSIQIAFEHLERYHQKTLSVLQQSSLADAVTLYHTPLKPYTGPDGAAYSYYDCEPALQALAEAIDKPTPVILALVDGPPKSTGIHARYPALPLLLKYFPDAQIDLILDDYNRPEEKEVANKWLVDLEALHIRFDCIEEDLDKGACRLTIQARNVSE